MEFSTGNPGRRVLTLGQTRFNLGLTTHFVLHIVTNYKERKDSPATGREEGVENQSPDRLLMTTQETELTTSFASDLENTAETTQFECIDCQKSFGSLRGLKIHQGKVCKKQKKQCKPLGYKTRSKSSRDENHSGEIMATAESAETPAVIPDDILVEKKAKSLLASQQQHESMEGI